MKYCKVYSPRMSKDLFFQMALNSKDIDNLLFEVSMKPQNSH